MAAAVHGVAGSLFQNTLSWSFLLETNSGFLIHLTTCCCETPTEKKQKAKRKRENVVVVHFSSPFARFPQKKHGQQKGGVERKVCLSVWCLCVCVVSVCLCVCVVSVCLCVCVSVCANGDPSNTNASSLTFAALTRQSNLACFFYFVSSDTQPWARKHVSLLALPFTGLIFMQKHELLA